MSEPRKGGRPRKHLEDEHHFKTSDDAAAAGAPPAVADSGQADASDGASAPDSASAELTHEAVVENPTLEPVNVISTESPIEKKIRALSDAASLNGWHPIETDTVLNSPPRNGMAVRIAESIEDEGRLAYWKRTRAFNGKRYAETGVWLDFHTSQKISFEPKYWRERF